MKINPYKTITLWGIWAFMAVMVYFTLYMDAKIWVFIESDPSHITWISLVLFVMATVASGLLAIKITVEGIGLKRIQEAARVHGLHGVSEFGNKGAAQRFFFALEETIKADGDPNAEVLAHIELAGYHRVSNGVEVMGNLLITLGLIGTVMGLTLTLTGLESAIDSLGQNQDLLLAGLRKAMGGMGTSFYTTLVGAVLGGVLLRIFAQITENGVAALYDQVMRICLVYCSADYKPSLGRELRFVNTEMERLEHNINLIQNSFASSRDTMMAFREELRIFVEGGSHKEDESLDTIIRRHQEYCRLLREEIHLINAVNHSWWGRLKILFGAKR